MSGFLQDVRFGLRTLAKQPGFAAAAILSLAIGIGVNSAVFSLAETALLRSWPAHDPAHLAEIEATTPQGPDEFSFPQYQDIAQQNQSFQGVLAYSRRAKTLSVGEESQLILDDVVSPNYFSVLELEPQRGRFFFAATDADDDQAVVISDHLWRKFFAADPRLVGQQIVLTNRNYTVIGIAPAHFRGLQVGVPTDLWLTTGGQLSSSELTDRTYSDFELFARFRPGATAARARADLDLLSARFAATYPALEKGLRLILYTQQDRLHGAAAPTMMVMSGVLLVLLIASANVSGLILAKSESRRREIAVRVALGASRGRLIRQLLTESSLLTFSGAALGLALVPALFRLQPYFFPPTEFQLGVDLRLDAGVVAFTLALCVFLVAFVGLAPALQAVKPDLLPALKSDQSSLPPMRRFTLRSALVVGEIALSVILLACSGLLLRSLIYSQRLSLGFNARNLTLFDLTPQIAGYDSQRSESLFDRITAQISGMPGVVSATYASRMLLSDSGGGASRRVSIPGVLLPQGQNSVPVKFLTASPGYFQTLGTRMFEGRGFTPSDSRRTTAIVIISENMAQRFWPQQVALGRHILVEGKDCQIVGVVEDAKINHIHENTEPFMYLPFAQSPTAWATLIVRNDINSRAFTSAVRDVIRSDDRNVPVSVRTSQSLMQEAFWTDRLAAGFVGALSALGVFLAAVGLYGVIAYIVGRREHEIGIRRALGASAKDVLRLILGQGLLLDVFGIAIGLAAALAVSRLLSSFLYGVLADDPLTFCASALVAAGITLAASYIPARRAMRVDPMVALRNE